MERQLIINRLRSARRTAHSLGERLHQPDFGTGMSEFEQDLVEFDTEIEKLE